MLSCCPGTKMFGLWPPLSHLSISSSLAIRPMMVVSSANLMMVLELWVTKQSCVNREYRRGLSMQPWGAPVLRVRVDGAVLPICTAWCLPVRKLRIQSQKGQLSPRSLSLVTSFKGTMVLNAELESMNSILTYVSLCFRWEKAVCKVREMASADYLFGL